MRAIGDIVYRKADGDVGVIREAEYDTYMVRWDGFDLTPHFELCTEDDFGPKPPTAWERMKALGIVYDGRDGSLEQTDEDRKFTAGTDWEDA
jgi:hypothetical protein